ncbi:MAG: hypothetical protein K2G25_01365 [Oscillospiraceae bacterium]|nr:hypothetical protein [Oscillospiraceae bacterium]
MKSFYCLILTDTDLCEDFLIGIFSDKTEAEKIAAYYLTSVQGLCEYPCTERIVKKYIAELPLETDVATKIDKVWIVQGWNVNEDYDEIAVIESNLYLTKERAEQELHLMQKDYVRTEWAVDCWKIGKLNWTDGFIRV